MLFHDDRAPHRPLALDGTEKTDKKADPAKSDAPKADKEPIPPPKRFVTHHKGSFHGAKLNYTVTAGETHLTDADGKPRASLFTFAYIRDGAGDPAKRPVTFLFNGGPGSASLWLHMGAFGPRRIVVPGDGTGAGVGPYTVVDNPLCPLDQTDLIFIDPVGTGYSKVLGEMKPEEAWGLDGDAGIIGDFIKRWLTENKRWDSPRYMLGESYGTTRAVAVAGKLQGGLAGVAVEAPGLLGLHLAQHLAVAGPDRIDEHQIGLVERAERIVDDGIGADAGAGAVARHYDAARAEGAHMQPQRGGTGTAVEQERHRALGRIAGAVADIGEGEQAGARLAVGIGQMGFAGRDGVVELGAVEAALVLGDEALGRGRRLLLGLGRIRLGRIGLLVVLVVLLVAVEGKGTVWRAIVVEQHRRASPSESQDNRCVDFAPARGAGTSANPSCTAAEPCACFI